MASREIWKYNFQPKFLLGGQRNFFFTFFENKIEWENIKLREGSNSKSLKKWAGLRLDNSSASLASESLVSASLVSASLASASLASASLASASLASANLVSASLSSASLASENNKKKIFPQMKAWIS